MITSKLLLLNVDLQAVELNHVIKLYVLVNLRLYLPNTHLDFYYVFTHKNTELKKTTFETLYNAIY